ncbi:MAG: DUF4105 domain-containing protein [Bacteroidales bacterium]|nr:DUF4105 domain-containing protein [Bacteroidales bacterium]
MKKIISLLVAFLVAIPYLSAQNFFSDSLEVSLLTCGQGPDAYERFGHTAIRIHDLKQQQNDLVFHYGVFSFNTPFFVWRFVKGETDYQLGAQETHRFIEGYRRRGLMMFEQKLSLNQAQTSEVARLLIENYAPQNRVYRYNYFFDNCATRPFHLIGKACQNEIRYDSLWLEPTTYRTLVRNKTHSGTWLDFGITLAIGMGADRSIGLEQQIFLPDYLATAYEHASVNGQPLVASTDTLLTISPEVEKLINAPKSILDPLPLLSFILCLAMILLAYRIKQNKPEGKHADRALKLSNIFDTIFLFTTGIVAVIIWFLLLGSEHPTVNENLNCVWLWPTNLCFCALIWTKIPQKVHRIYFLINFAALIIYFACVTSGSQEASPEVLLLAAILLLRCIERIFFNEKETIPANAK